MSEQIDPVLFEKFMVLASSPDCKCRVTATSTVDGNVLAIATYKCKGHDAVSALLKKEACDRVTMMVNRYVLFPSLADTGIFTTGYTAPAQPTGSEGSNVQLPLARSTT